MELALEEDGRGEWSNRRLLARVRALLERDRRREEARQRSAAEQGGGDGHRVEEEGEAGLGGEDDEGGDGGGEASDGDDEARAHEDMAEDAIIRGALPVPGEGASDGQAVGVPGSERCVEQMLSAAGPAPGLGEARAVGGGGRERLVFEQAGCG